MLVEERDERMAEHTMRTELDKENLIDILTEELPSLRAKIGLTQEELSDIIGISRPTYSVIEAKKRRMSWNIGAFPTELRELLNINNR